MGEIINVTATISIEINPNQTTADFEQWFAQTYNLHIQVFRNQRGTWLQTTHSDAMTLQEQNEKRDSS